MKVTILGFLGLSVAWSTAQAQTVPKVSVAVEAAGTVGGPLSDMDTTLQAAGLAGEYVGIFGPVHSPRHDRLPGWGADLRIRVRPRVSLGVAVGRSVVGSTFGSSEPLFAPTFQADY